MIPADLPQLRLHISAFDNAFDVHPKPRETTLVALIRALTTLPVIAVANKLELPAWSPARFAAGTERKSRNVVEIGAIVFDYDGGDPDQALALWAGCVAIVHSTYSHTAEAPRFRVVVPLAKPIPASLWASAWDFASTRAHGADAACKDPSRLYFRPALPRVDAPHFTKVQGGQLFDIGEVPPIKTRTVRPRMPVVKVPARLRDRAIAARLRSDGRSRECVAQEIGAEFAGQGEARRAIHLRCPSCGEASVWFYMVPSRMSRARCNHRNSCGWTGTLDELLVRSAA